MCSRMFIVRVALAFAAFAICSGNVISLEYEDFILGEPEVISKTEAGEIRALMGSHDNPALRAHDVALGFVTMEPRALLLPHYMDAAITFYVQRGDAMIGWVRGNNNVKKNLKSGDLYTIPAGAVVYVLNKNDNSKLELVGIHDTSNSLHKGRVEGFFVAGGESPKVTLAGFSSDVLAAALKVSEKKVLDFLSSQTGGSIIRTTFQTFDEDEDEDENVSGFWTYLKSVVSSSDDGELEKKHKKHKKDEDEKKHKKDKDDKKHKDDDKKKDETFNLFEKRSFENEHGWIASTIGEEVRALAAGRIGVSIARLRPGSMLAPHWNPEGAEFAVVTNGSGTIQIAFPNGTNAVDAKVSTGTVFHVPQFLPVCQIAASRQPLEFVVFTVSSPSAAMQKEGVQFLAGKDSIFQKLDLGILALAFNLPDHLVASFLNSQEEAIILPAAVSSV